LLTKWSSLSDAPDAKESCKRLVDLFLVSVLLDAGAGNAWAYREVESGQRSSRSEGLGVASVHMFEHGLFSGDRNQPYRVDAGGLSRVTIDAIATEMQVTASNPMVGLEGRALLLMNLAKALKASPEFFGEEGRPGNIIDFLESQSILSNSEPKGRTVPIAALWHALLTGLNPIWPPSRTSLGGISLGDVWPCSALKVSLGSNWKEGDDLVPFHKLTAWTTYSLIEPMQKLLKWKFEGLEDMTGLPEYRNGGLLVDLGVLTLKPSLLPLDAKSGLPRVPPSHPAIVEWRAVTVIQLDRIATSIRESLNLTPEQLTLAQVLESATWKGGREIAKQKRPQTGGPPIEIESDGTVF